MVNNCDKCLKKLTVRNFITVATITVFLAIVLQIIFVDPDITENSVLMFILGAFMTAVTMIYTFYYRKNKTRRDIDDLFDFDNIDGNICPCCGQKIRNRKR